MPMEAVLAFHLGKFLRGPNPTDRYRTEHSGHILNFLLCLQNKAPRGCMCLSLCLREPGFRISQWGQWGRERRWVGDSGEHVLPLDLGGLICLLTIRLMPPKHFLQSSQGLSKELAALITLVIFGDGGEGTGEVCGAGCSPPSLHCD